MSNSLKSGSTVELREISKNKQNHCADVGYTLGIIRTVSRFIKEYRNTLTTQQIQEELIELKCRCKYLKLILKNSYLTR